MSRLDKLKQDAKEQVNDLPNGFFPCLGESQIHEKLCLTSSNCIKSCPVVDLPNVIDNLIPT